MTDIEKARKAAERVRAAVSELNAAVRDAAELGVESVIVEDQINTMGGITFRIFVVQTTLVL